MPKKFDTKIVEIIAFSGSKKLYQNCDNFTCWKGALHVAPTPAVPGLSFFNIKFGKIAP